MNATEAVSRLRNLGSPVVTTGEAALLLNVSIGAANKTLARLAKPGLVTPIRRGLWAMGDRIDPLVLPPYLTAPSPSYVSLQSALYLHGMISQIPAVIYVSSIGRSQPLRTRLATFSIHRLAPEFFGGFEMTESGINLATAEKALLDIFYLSPTSSRRFAALPELELPPGFRIGTAREWIGRIRSKRLRTIVNARFAAALVAARARRR